MTRSARFKRRKTKFRGVAVDHFPTEPGWWIRWTGRTDWFPICAEFADWLKGEMADGDRLVFISNPGEK